jgi:hypothetical protein
MPFGAVCPLILVLLFLCRAEGPKTILPNLIPCFSGDSEDPFLLCSQLCGLWEKHSCPTAYRAENTNPTSSCLLTFYQAECIHLCIFNIHLPLYTYTPMGMLPLHFHLTFDLFLIQQPRLLYRHANSSFQTVL